MERMNLGKVDFSIRGEETDVTSANAELDFEFSVWGRVVKDGRFFSPVADAYRDRLSEFGIYCKEEEAKNWITSCRSLVNSMQEMVIQNEKTLFPPKFDWSYETLVFEKTAQYMEILAGEVNWDEVCNDMRKYKYFGNGPFIEDVSEMLLVYSPRGVDFVDNAVKVVFEFDKMTKIQDAYTLEKKRVHAKEAKKKKELGTRLVKCLDSSVKPLGGQQ